MAGRVHKVARVAVTASLLLAAEAASSQTARAALSWTPAADLFTTPVVANEPQVVADSNGTMVAVWSESRPSSSAIVWARKPASGAWSAPADLVAPPADHFAVAPDLAIDSQGTVSLLWVQTDQDGIGSDGYTLRAAQMPRDGAFGAPDDIATSTGNAAIGRKALAVAPDGELTAIWQRDDGVSLYQVESAYKPAGGDWTAPDDVAPDASGERAPQVAVDGAGRAVAVFQTGQTPTVIEASNRDAAGNWDTPVPINGTPNSASGSSEPYVAIDGSGTATAIWRRTNVATQVAETATHPVGGPWSSPDVISDAGPSINDLKLDVNSGGDAIAAWFQGTPNVLVRAKRRTSGVWQATHDTLSAAGQNGLRPIPLIDDAGNATVLWNRSNGTDYVIQAAQSPAGGSFGGAFDVGIATDDDSDAAAFASRGAGGNVAAIWRTGASPDFALRAALGVTGPPACSGGSAALDAGAGVTIDLACTGIVASRAIASGPSKGTLGAIDQAAGKVTFTAAGGSSGADSFTFVGQNAAGDSVAATVSLTINAAPGPSPGPDKSPPGLKLSGAKRQKAGRTVNVAVQCSEACTATGTGKVKTRNRKRAKRSASIGLKRAESKLAANQTRTLKLKLSAKKLKTVKRTLKRRGKASAAVTVTARDAAGNVTTAKRTVTLKR